VADPDDRDTGYRVQTRERTAIPARRVAAPVPAPFAAGSDPALELADPSRLLPFGNVMVAVTWREGRVLLELTSGLVLSATPSEAAALARALTAPPAR
jgi:hypothetical protein